MRIVAGLIACAIAVTGIATVADGYPPASVSSKKHDKHKCHKKKKQQKKKCRKKRKKPAPAGPSPTPADPIGTSVAVDAIAGGAFHLQFAATRANDQPPSSATGTFTGTLAPAGDEIGHFAGPVTCLEVDGNDIGLFYPIAGSNPPGIEAFNAGVFISVKVDGQGHATMAGFLPVPQPTADHCPPSQVPQLMPAEGTGTIS